MALTLRQLTYFSATVDNAGVTEAARILNVSQPSVSSAIGQLEQMLGDKLFLRQPGRANTLTPFGQVFALEAKSLLAQANTLGSLGKSRGHNAPFPVTIACFSNLAPFFMGRFLADTAGEFRTKLLTGNFEQISKLLLDGVADFAITYDLHLDTGFDKIELAAFPPHVMLPEDHKLAALDYVPLKDIAKEPLIIADLAHSKEYMLAMCASRGLDIDVVYYTDSFEMQRSLVANGLGIAVSFTRPVRQESYDGKKLLVRPIMEKLAPQRIVLAKPKTATYHLYKQLASEAIIRRLYT